MKNPLYLRMSVFLSFLGCAPAFAQLEIEMHEGHETAARSVLVKFKAGSTAHGIQQLGGSQDIDTDVGIGGIGVRKVRSRTKSVAALLAHFRARADVEYAEPDYIVHSTAVPNDPAFGQLWGLQNTGQVIGTSGIPGADISAVPAWDLTLGSRANVVAVVDTGVDYTHPDLAANIWSAPSPFTVTFGLGTLNILLTCPAGTHGFNAINFTCDPMDDHFHGTHVSGTVGAVGNNALGVVGVNQAASIMGAKFLDASGSGSISGAINAIEFTIQAKILTSSANVRVLSNSWACSGDCFSQGLLDEINRANANDILFVAAAGNSANNNDALPTYPASYGAPNVVAVAATDNRDQLASFSNYGAGSVHLGAPGVNVYSTTPQVATNAMLNAGLPTSYGYLSGTSMATPHVSGAAALVLSDCALNTAQLKSVLLNNVDPIPALSGKTVTGGRLNVNNALLSCAPNAPPARLTYSTPNASYFVGATIANDTPSSRGGLIASYSVLPALPGGLVLDPHTGVISGTPTTPAATATYIVTAANPFGSTSTGITITVTAPFCVPNTNIGCGCSTSQRQQCIALGGNGGLCVQTCAADGSAYGACYLANCHFPSD